MEKITREQAEKLVLKSHIVKTELKQNKKELRLLMKLTDNKSLLVSYDIQKGKKTFFIDRIKR